MLIGAGAGRAAPSAPDQGPQHHRHAAAIVWIIEPRLIRQPVAPRRRYQRPVAPAGMQPARPQAMRIRRLRLAQQARAKRVSRRRRHRQQGPGGTGEIPVQNRPQGQTASSIRAAGPGPNRAETCATSSTAGRVSPSLVCAPAL